MIRTLRRLFQTMFTARCRVGGSEEAHRAGRGLFLNLHTYDPSSALEDGWKEVWAPSRSLDAA
jgi:hypothetical protein